MALSYTGGTVALSSWGFGAGDIISMVGAGRAVGTWLMAQHEDRGFLNLLGSSSSDILRRKGLVDAEALHRRWDKELTLLQNGKIISIRHPTMSGTMIQSMDRFTWCMTLFVAALDATTDTRVMRRILQNFMIKTLEDRTDAGSEELLIHGLQKHIEGWRSAACVRGIALEAREHWKRLAKKGKHLPGNIPVNDSAEIERMLLWMTTGQENRFITTSTDVYCLTDILAHIGFEDQLKTTCNAAEDCDESQMLLVLDTSFVPVHNFIISRIHKLELRRGIRIPLDAMEESVSQWAGDTKRGNTRRDIFSSGMRASRGVKLTVALKSETLYDMDDDLLDVFYIVRKDSEAELPRIQKDMYRLLDGFFLASTPSTADGLKKLVSTWSSDRITEIGWWLQDLHTDRDTDEELDSLDATTTTHLADLVIFVLGYYYAVLMPLIVTTQLSNQEAIGSWGFNDIQVLRVLRQFKLSADARNEGRFARHMLLRVLAYMFAGAHFKDQLPSVSERAVGVLGKLVLVSGSVVGQADCPEKVEKFWLLDIDQSCIPSNSRGIVVSGKQSRCPTTPPSTPPSTVDVLVTAAEPVFDFTSHIEPDWEYDVQRVLVGYRHAGRMVHRISPIDSDIAVIKSWIEPSAAEITSLPRAIPVALEEFHGGFIVKKSNNSPQLDTHLVSLTKSLPKARTCITAMYGANVAALASNDIASAAGDKEPVLVIA